MRKVRYIGKNKYHQCKFRSKDTCLFNVNCLAESIVCCTNIITEIEASTYIGMTECPFKTKGIAITSLHSAYLSTEVLSEEV